MPKQRHLHGAEHRASAWITPAHCRCARAAARIRRTPKYKVARGGTDMAVKPPDIPLPSELLGEPEIPDSPAWDTLRFMAAIHRRIWEW